MSALAFAALSAERVSAEYRPGEPVLRDISLRLERGKILAVIGPNGSGKTTLFRALSGEMPLSGGSVQLQEAPAAPPRDIHSLSPRRRARCITRVLQNEHPAWSVSVSDYVEAGLFAKEGWLGRPRGGAGGAVRQSLARMKIEGLAQRSVTELSGGEFRRVVIARALVQNPDIFLLDEPTADLDMAHQMDTLEILRKLARSGKALAFSVHDLNLAAMAADEVLLLVEGRIAAFGSPASVLTPEIIQKAYGARVVVREHPGAALPHVIPAPAWLSKSPEP